MSEPMSSLCIWMLRAALSLVHVLDLHYSAVISVLQFADEYVQTLSDNILISDILILDKAFAT